MPDSKEETTKEYFVRIAETRAVTVPVRAHSVEEAKKLATDVYRNLTAEEFMSKSEYYEGTAYSGDILDVQDADGKIVG